MMMTTMMLMMFFYNRLRCLVLEYVNEGDTGKHGKTIPIRISTSSNGTARLKI